MKHLKSIITGILSGAVFFLAIHVGFTKGLGTSLDQTLSIAEMDTSLGDNFEFSKGLQSEYYFNVISSQQVGIGACDLTNSTVEPFLTDESGDEMPPEQSPSTDCEPDTDYCCVLAFEADDIEHVQISPGQWVWRPIAGRTPSSYEKREDDPAR